MSHLLPDGQPAPWAIKRVEVRDEPPDPRVALDRLLTNTFCPTGPGGGIDPSCSHGGKSTGVRTPESAVQEVAKEYEKIGMTVKEANGGDCYTAAKDVIDIIRKSGGQAHFAFPMRAPTHIWVYSGKLHYDLEAPAGVKRAQDLPFFKRNPELYSPWDDSADDPLAAGGHFGKKPPTSNSFRISKR